MSITFFRRWLTVLLLTVPIGALYAQEYRYEIGGMGGGAFYMGDANKNAVLKGLNPSIGMMFRYNASAILWVSSFFFTATPTLLDTSMSS